MPKIEELLEQAVENSDLQALNELLDILETKECKESNFDINFLNKDGDGLLHIAVKKRSPNIINRLLQVKTIDINLLSNLLSGVGCLPLNLAISNFSKAIVNSLLQDERIDVNKKDKQIIIIEDRDRMLTEKEVEIYHREGSGVYIGFGKTPLLCAAESGQKDILKKLLQNPKTDITTCLKETFLVAISNLSSPSMNENEESQKNHVDIMNLLFKLGGGIGCVISEPAFTFSPEFNTKGMIVIGKIIKSSKEGDEIIKSNFFERITRKTPGFEEAITSVAECEKAIESGLFNWDQLNEVFDRESGYFDISYLKGKPGDKLNQLVSICDEYENVDPMIEKEINKISELLDIHVTREKPCIKILLSLYEIYVKRQGTILSVEREEGKRQTFKPS